MNSFKCSSRSLLDFYDEDRLVMDVVDEIEKELNAQNKVVCQFLIDGRPLTVEGEGAWSQKRLSQVEQIEYQVADLMTLVKEVAEGWIEAIDEQIEPIIAVSLEMGDNPNRRSFLKLEQVFDWCSEFVDSLSTMKMNRSQSIAVQLLEWDRLETQLSGTVRELLTKSEKKDFKGVAYTLEYDLIDTLQSWSKELEKFVAQIRRAQEGNSSTGPGKSASGVFIPVVGRSRAIN